MPSVLPVYARDLDISKYFIGYFQHPYIFFILGGVVRQNALFVYGHKLLVDIYIVIKARRR
jgi:hypothetical protein